MADQSFIRTLHLCKDRLQQIVYNPAVLKRWSPILLRKQDPESDLQL